MATEAALANLPVPARELVSALSTSSPEALGRTDEEKAAISAYIASVGQGKYAPESVNLEELDKELTSKTYLVGNTITVADVAVYAALHPTVSILPSSKYYTLPSITRYFDHIQNHSDLRTHPSLAASSSLPALVPFDLDNAPKVERKPPITEKKKKDKAPVADAAEGAVETAKTAGKKVKEAVSAATAGTSAAAEDAAGKGKKKEKGKAVAGGGEGSKKEKAAPAPAKEAEGSGEPVPSMIDLRVGHIVHIEKHPDADGLYVEQIDLGEPEGPRTVVSGLVNYIPIEEMRDKYLVAVCNLKPANMRGVKSHAMVLCATSPAGREGGIELVEPPPGSKPGERVYFEGEKYEDAQPLSQLNPKKKIFETIQPGFTTLETHEAAWVDPATKSVHRIRTKDGVCIAPKFVGASLS